MFYLLSMKLQMQRNFVLRWNVLWSFIANMLWLLLYKLLWTSIYGNRTEITGISLEYLLGYYLMVRIIGRFTSNRVDRELSRGIMNGLFTGELIRPVNVLWHKTGDWLGSNLVNTLLVGIPTIAMAAFILPFPTPAGITAVICFGFSLIVGFLIQININMLAGMAAFWIKGAEGVTHAKDFIVQIASGGLIPLAFLPAGFQKAFMFLPFRYVVDIPVRMYYGGLYEIKASEIAVGVMWCILLAAINRAVFKKGVKKLTAYGG